MKTVIHLKPIKSKTDYRKALTLIEKYFEAKRGTAEADLLEILSILVERYEQEHYPIASPDPIEAIKFRMEQLGLSQKDLVEFIGSRSRVSEVLSGKRRLTVDMIRSLHHGLGVPAESLIGV